MNTVTLLYTFCMSSGGLHSIHHLIHAQMAFCSLFENICACVHTVLFSTPQTSAVPALLLRNSRLSIEGTSHCVGQLFSIHIGVAWRKT